MINIKDLNNVFSGNQLFVYGQPLSNENHDIICSVKNSASRYYVVDFIDMEPTGKVVLRTLDHFYHKTKPENIEQITFKDRALNLKVDLETASQRMTTIKQAHQANRKNIYYIIHKIFDWNDPYYEQKHENHHE